MQPQAGETAEQWNERLKAAGVDIRRTADAQRRMHAATTEARQAGLALEQALAENTELQAQLDVLNVRPDLVPIPGGEGPGDPQQEISTLVDEYEKVPQGQDRQALMLLATRLLEIGQRRTLTAAQRQDIATENNRRLLAVHAEVRKATEAFVNKVAPDIKMRWFWSAVTDAERLVPPELQGPSKARDRMDWVAKQAITMARADLADTIKATREAAAQADSSYRAAGAIMPGHGAAPLTPVRTGAEQPKTFVEQIQERRGKMLPVT